ncbi:MAG: RdgB/HAM1 family non-canonical purine NTP pyrophosphatase [Armatimonadetes bacterium]|nr:RdgB/HAM1 family non-canonical purine NTP pyrophosphatase [Armatimonadota bacterium]
MLQLVVGSNNPGKIREIRQMLAAWDMKVVSYSEAGGAGDLPEEGQTFEENAAAKAVEAARRTGLLALADDSGLCVEALGGRPGVLSALYGGAQADDATRCRLLLEELRAAATTNRLAEFVCVLALATPEGLVACWAGRVVGVIADEPRGAGGFGYDPIFLYLPAGRTLAEMPPQEKNAVSHRGRAVRRLPEVLSRHGFTP